MSLIKKVVIYSLHALVVVFLLAPIALIVISSFKSNLDIFSYPPQILFSPSFQAYFSQPGQTTVFAPALDPRWIGPYFNTFVLSIGSTGLAVLLGLPAAYALARFPVRGKESIAMSILSLRMVPVVAATVPLYFMMNFLGLLNSHAALLIVYTLFELPYVVWLMRGFIENVPREITEAAEVDGASQVRTIVQVLLPLVRTGLMVTIVFCILMAYNDYAIASLLGGFNTQTMPVALSGLIGQQRVYWNVIFAVGSLNLIPTTILVFVVRRYWATGFTLGLIKG